MKNEPDIIKELKEAEKLGKLYVVSRNDNENKKIDECIDNISNELSKNLANPLKRFEKEIEHDNNLLQSPWYIVTHLSW